MNTGYYVITRDRVFGREFYRWSDALMDVVWISQPTDATHWTRKEDADRVAVLHKGVTVQHRVD